MATVEELREMGLYFNHIPSSIMGQPGYDGYTLKWENHYISIDAELAHRVSASRLNEILDVRKAYCEANYVMA